MVFREMNFVCLVNIHKMLDKYHILVYLNILLRTKKTMATDTYKTEKYNKQRFNKEIEKDKKEESKKKRRKKTTTKEKTLAFDKKQLHNSSNII